MSNDWFRSWHGAPTDPKWRTIAKRAKVASSLVVAIAWALMDRASQSTDRGSINGLDYETIADFLDCDPTDVERVICALRDKKILYGDQFVAWERRQPKREREDDNSTERGRAFRERHKNNDLEKSKGGVSDAETPINANQRQSTPREDKKRVDKKEFISSAEADFKRLREVYPRRPGDSRKLAFRAFTKAIRSTNIEIIIAGAEVYAKSREGQDPQYTKTLSAWLNAEMWDAEWGPKRNGSANGHDVELDQRLIGGHPRELIFDLGCGFSLPLRNLPNAIKNWRERGFWAPGSASPPFGSLGCKIPDEYLPDDLRQGAQPP